MKINHISATWAFLLLFSLPLTAQISSGGRPIGLVPHVQQLLQQRNQGATVLPVPDRQRLAAEDRQGPGNRFAAPIPTDFTLDNAGVWMDLPSGDRLWQLRLQADGAQALAALYEAFYLPPGSTLYMYSPDGSQVKGAYTQQNNPASQRFMTGLIRGEEAIVEYHEPAAVRGQGRFRIFRVDYAYRLNDGRTVENFGFDASLPCHENANCTLGDGLEDQARGICRIIVVVAEGMGYCTGNLLNNAREDGTPYIYTGFHCMDGYTPLYDLWRFDFNYASDQCADPGVEPDFDSVLGSTFRAGRQQNDFLLLEATETIPLGYEVFFQGWDRDEAAPDTMTIFHHPVGDIKKVAVSTDPTHVFNGPITWNNDVVTPAQHHFDVDYTSGSFEVGSSGAALLNQNGKMVGHLHGGNPVDCAETQGYFGRLSMAWTGGGTADTRLMDWLDPDGLDPDTLSGMNQLGSGTVSGLITTAEDEPMANVAVTIYTDTDTSTVLTDASGTYTLDGFVVGASFSVILDKADQVANGVTISDIIIIRKAILGLELITDPYWQLAADVNDSGNISTLDIIQIQRVILQMDQVFASVPDWRFLPADFTFTDPTDPFEPNLPFTVEDLTMEALTELDFIGIKSGDANGTANPN